MATTETVRSAGSRDASSLSPRAKLVAALCVLVFIAVALLITGLKDRPEVTLDPQFGIPPHPTQEELRFIPRNHLIATVAMFLVGFTGVVLGIRHYLRTKSPIPMVIALSAAVICIPEVFFDVMGGVYFPWDANEPLGEAFHIIGRTMPVWIIMGWFGYGIFAYFAYMMLLRRPSTKELWLFWGAALAGDVVFEELLLQLDVYHYYGNHPLVLIDELPWWWLPCNSIGVILAASIAYRLRHELTGFKALAPLIITPMSVPLVYGAVGMPGWIAVNSDLPWLPTQLLGMLTLVLGVFAFMAVLRFVLNRKPLDLDYVPADNEFAIPAGPDSRQV